MYYDSLPITSTVLITFFKFLFITLSLFMFSSVYLSLILYSSLSPSLSLSPLPLLILLAAWCHKNTTFLRSITPKTKHPPSRGVRKSFQTRNKMSLRPIIARKFWNDVGHKINQSIYVLLWPLVNFCHQAEKVLTLVQLGHFWGRCTLDILGSSDRIRTHAVCSRLWRVRCDPSCSTKI